MLKSLSQAKTAMYGMINRAIEDLVVATDGRETWDEILDKADINVGEFNDCESYDDALTFKLVAAASEVTGQSSDSILHAFGRHWILYTGREGWGAVFDSAGNNFIDFIRGLDAMHSRVQLAMPHLKMPSFSVIPTEIDGQFTIGYRSDREGFSPMVVGLLTGLAEQFNERWDIEQTGWRSENGFDSFTVRDVSIDCAQERAISAG